MAQMSLTSFRFLPPAVLSITLFAGCAPQQAYGGPPICYGPALPYFVMLYPENQAAGVPDGPFTLVLTGTYDANISLRVSQSQALVSSSLPSAPVPSPLPSPSQTSPPGFSGPSGYAVPKLAPSTTYTLSAGSGTGVPCAESETIGTFTTQ